MISKVKSSVSYRFSKFRGFSFKKKSLVIFIFILVIIVLFNVIGGFFKKPGYTTEKVEKRNITEVVTESGAISTNGRIDVYSPTNGVVEEVYVKNGDSVIDGQDLIKIKSSATVQEQQSAYSNYLAAKKALEDGKTAQYTYDSSMYSKWDTFKTLAESDQYENSDGVPKYENRSSAEFHVAENEWLAAEQKSKDQEIAVSQAQASLNSTWLLYQATQDSIVKSTSDGVIANLSVTTGSGVGINTPTSVTPPVLSIGNFSKTEANVPLNENDVAKVKEGQEVEIDVDAVNDKTYKGIVSRVDEIGTSVQGVIRYNSYIEITDPDNRLRPGMSIDGKIITKKLTNVLSVPNSSVKPYKGGRAVRVPDKGNQIKFIPVRVGVRGETYTQILDGLKEGQEIITNVTSESSQKSSPLGF